jgi:Ni,Fe-hydrogenase I cytochrome b subunit
MLNDQNDKALFFREPKPASIRAWHWLAFLFFTATIITVIFASTLFKTSNNISMVQQQVQHGGGTITDKQARSVAHE